VNRLLVLSVVVMAATALGEDGGVPAVPMCTFGGKVLKRSEAYTVVSLEPAGPAGGRPALPRPPSARRVMYQRDRTFRPAYMVLNAGDWVVFQNDDYEWHSVFSSSQPYTFDMGVSNRGVSGERHFERPGIVRIQCNRHSKMRADLIIVGSTAWAEVAADGTWRIDAPAGTWNVVVSDINGATKSERVSGCVTDLELTLPRPPVDRPRAKNGDVGSQYDVSNH
jgi:plastocyanin